MTREQAETYRLKSDAEFHLGLLHIADMFYWYKNSEDIAREVEAYKALQSREETHGREQAQAV